MEIQDPATVIGHRTCGSGIDYGICPACKRGHGYIIRITPPRKPKSTSRLPLVLASACKAAELHWQNNRHSIVADPRSPESKRYTSLLSRCQIINTHISTETTPK